MALLVVEIHVPVGADADMAWIEGVEDFLADLEDAGDLEVYDDAERVGEFHVFYVTGKQAPKLLAAASRTVTRPGVPAGAFAIVTDDKAAHGAGKRIPLPTR